MYFSFYFLNVSFSEKTLNSFEILFLFGKNTYQHNKNIYCFKMDKVQVLYFSFNNSNLSCSQYKKKVTNSFLCLCTYTKNGELFCPPPNIYFMFLWTFLKEQHNSKIFFSNLPFLIVCHICVHFSGNFLNVLFHIKKLFSTFIDIGNTNNVIERHM